MSSLRFCRLLLLCAISCPGGMACLAQNDANAPTPLEQSELVRGLNDFGIKLFQHMRAQNTGNCVISPLSIHAALSMASVGANGETRQELLKALGSEAYFARTQQVWPGPHNLAARQAQASGKMQFQVSNHIFCQDDFKVKPEFIKSIQEQFSAGAELVNFRQTEEACKRINGWVAEATRGRLTAVLNPANRSLENAKIALLNAVYFYSKWHAGFDKQQTKKETFHLMPGKTAEVMMMRQLDCRNYYLAVPGKYKLASLPYLDRRFAMLIMVPEAVDGLAGLENTITANSITENLNAASAVNMSLYLPKFKFELPATKMTEALKAQGIQRALAAESADFFNIATRKSIEEVLFISQVIHAACIEVDEAGTEAAAATAVAFSSSGIGGSMDDGNIVFKADRPFLFLIRDNESGALVFIGRVTNPLPAAENK